MTNITKIPSDPINLRISDLSEGQRGESLAYLIRGRKLLDKNGDTYLSFTLRSADKCTIIGRKFRINSTELFDFLDVQRAVVLIRYEVCTFNGEYCLQILGMDLAAKGDPSIFFDSYSETDKALDYLNSEAKKYDTKAINPIVSKMMLYSISNGRQGGILELILCAYKMLLIHENQPWFKRLVQVFFGSVESYIDYRLIADKLEFVPKNESIALLNSNLGSEGYQVKSAIYDSLLSLMHLGEPEHLFAHFIVEAYQQSEVQLEMVERVKLAASNSVVKIGNKSVTYY